MAEIDLREDFGDLPRLVVVDGPSRPVFVAEAAGPGAGVSEDHDGRGARDQHSPMFGQLASAAV